MLARTATATSALRANALTGAGVLASMQGDYPAANAFNEESLALHRQLGNPNSIAYALNNLANIAVQQGDYERARALYTECVTARPLDRRRARPGVRAHHLAGVAAELGDEAGAKAGFEEASPSSSASATAGGSVRQDEFATVLAREGDASTAGSLHEMALETWRGSATSAASPGRSSTSPTSPRSRAPRGGPEPDPAEPGDPPGARRHARDRRGDGEAGLGPGPGSAGGGGRLIGCAEALREAIRAPIPSFALADHARRLAALRERLGDSAYAEALGEGQTMAPVEVVATLPA